MSNVSQGEKIQSIVHQKGKIEQNKMKESF